MADNMALTARTTKNLMQWLADIKEDIAYHKEQIAYYREKGGNTDFVANHIRNGFQRHQQWLAEAQAEYITLKAEIEWLEFMDAETMCDKDIRHFPDHRNDWAVDKQVSLYWDGRWQEEKGSTKQMREHGAIQRQAAYDELGYLMYWCDTEPTGEWTAPYFGRKETR